MAGAVFHPGGSSDANFAVALVLPAPVDHNNDYYYHRHWLFSAATMYILVVVTSAA